jgi:CheY-like chemotaxis protein
MLYSFVEGEDDMSHKILLVEDTDDTREFMRFLLEEMLGYQVVEAANGFQAVQQTKQTHPDLILMDMAMPIMDGIAATREIRKQQETKDIPVIGITAFGVSFWEEAILAGCNEVIGKPVDPKSLKKTISHYLPS